jgi:FkbH-like protein
VDRRYRNHVLDVFTRHVSAEPGRDSGVEGANSAAPWMAGRRIYLVGGCELSYIEDFFSERGIRTHHTFDHGGAPEPLAEVLSPDTPLWSFDPHYIVLSQVQLFSGLVYKLQADGLVYTRAQQEQDLEDLRANAVQSIRKIRERLRAPVFLMTYLLGYRPAYGVHEYRSLAGHSLIELIRRYELMLYEISREHEDVYVLDVNVALEDQGKRDAIDRWNADGVYEHFTREGAARVAERLLYQCSALEPTLPRMKVAVFDLDGTLWTGVLREDGPAGISVRRNYVRILGHLARRGILLSICSKNDPAEERLLPDLLGKSLFERIVTRRLNWQPKSLNLRQIARELNVGLDAVAFFDDSPFERAEVEANAPGVRVFRDDEILSCLEKPEFEPLGELTPEAASRAEKYVEQAQRETAAASSESIEEFLKSCRLELTLRRPTESEIPRVHELLQRTNQLNATLRRTSLADLKQIYSRPDRVEMCAALLTDKFGDYGLIGLGIAERGPSAWTLAELAFSCRAMGKHVEHALLTQLAKRAALQGAQFLEIDFRPTERNQQLLAILESLRFKRGPAGGAEDTRLVRALSAADHETQFPAWLNVKC